MPDHRAYPETHWQEIAVLYDEMVATGFPPLKAIAKRYGIAHGTASQWARNCRRRGLLGPPSLEARRTRDGGACQKVWCPDCGAPMRHHRTRRTPRDLNA